MTDPSPRLFPDDASIRRVGEGLLACALPKVEWTHEAHLAACLWLLTERRDIDMDAEIAGIIRRYNESVGGVNDDTQGYHHTVTCAYVAGVRAFLRGSVNEAGLVERVNGLLRSPVGRRDWPLAFYSRDLLFSVDARRRFVAPDRGPLPEAVTLPR